MGSDTNSMETIRPQTISIHAPAWGATSWAIPGRRDIVTFQSTPPHGERPNNDTMLHETLSISIHAPAWGATVGKESNFCERCHFNPRPRMGSDKYLPELLKVEVKFQSTPPHGERPYQNNHRTEECEISIHAPAWGATAKT